MLNDLSKVIQKVRTKEGTDFQIKVPNGSFFFFFMAALGLRCCVQAFSSCGEQGYSLLWCAGSLCCGFSCCGAQALGTEAQ